MATRQRNENQQNQITTRHLGQLVTAISFLEHLGLTVTAFSAGDHTPRIDIQPGRGCAQLQHATRMWLNKDGRREAEKIALVEGCQVRWREPVDRLH